ncbi:MAG: hypothetical protein LAT56_13695 [Wenzhouxiangella sp.]|nr:hypothetical protein [Wenzhouxiangella sp.]
MIRPIFSAAALLCLSLAAASGLQAADFTVTRTDDPAGATCSPGNCSLRAAVQAAQATPGAHRIFLPNATIELSLSTLEVGANVQIIGNVGSTTRIHMTGPHPLLRVLDGGNVELRAVILQSSNIVMIEVLGSSSLRLQTVSQIQHNRWIAVHPEAVADLSIVDSFVGALVLCTQKLGRCSIQGSRIGSLILGGTTSQVEGHLQDCQVEGAPYVPPLLSGVIVNGTVPLAMNNCQIRNSLRPLALYQDGAVGPAPPVTVRRSRFRNNHGPIRGSRQGIVNLEEVWINGHVVDPDSGLSSDYTQAPSVLLADEGPDWRIRQSAINLNRGVATDGRTILLNPGARVLLENVLFENNTRPDALGVGNDGIGVYAGPGQAPQLRVRNSTILGSNLMQPGGPGAVFSARGPTADVRFDNSAISGTCVLQGGAPGPAGQNNAVTPFDCGLNPSVNFVWLTAALLDLEALDHWGGRTPSRPPGRLSALIGNGSPAHCTARDQRGAIRPPNGIACDIGSVQRGGDVRMFTDRFEDH